MKTIRDFDLKGKKVIIRCDFNVPIINGKITDDTRIKESLTTIEYAINNSAKVILMSHLGKIKTPEDMSKNTLLPVAKDLSKLLKQDVIFSPYTSGKRLENKINSMKEKDVLLMENTRYEDIPDKKESSCDLELSKYWASLGDIYINDAYGTCHRDHASVSGIPKFLPSGIGFLVEKEISKIDSIIKEDTHPFIIVMGGGKISDKIKLTKNLIKKCDKILIGGALCFTFFSAIGYKTYGNMVDKDSISFCKRMLRRYSHKIILPIDFVCADGSIKKINKLKEGDICFDIGPKSIRRFKSKLRRSKRILFK